MERWLPQCFIFLEQSLPRILSYTFAATPFQNSMQSQWHVSTDATCTFPLDQSDLSLLSYMSSFLLNHFCTVAVDWCHWRCLTCSDCCSVLLSVQKYTTDHKSLLVELLRIGKAETCRATGPSAKKEVYLWFHLLTPKEAPQSFKTASFLRLLLTESCCFITW